MFKLKKALIIFVLIIGIASIFCGNFSNTFASAEIDNRYIFEDYNVEVTISDDNRLTIKEDIVANYLVPMYGFTRYIPYGETSLIRKYNGKTYKNYYNISFSELKIIDGDYADIYKTEDNYIAIDFGADYNEHQISGLHSYSFSYVLNIGNNLIKEFDELYFNLISPNEMPQINNFSFKINLPHTFNTDNVWTYFGKAGATNSGNELFNVSFTTEENNYTIFGSSSSFIKAGDGLTVRALFEDGYFSSVQQPKSIYALVGTLIISILAGVSAFLFFKFGKNPKPITPVEFYPPENKDPASLAYLYKGSSSNKDLMMLIIYWANKKYLSISENNSVLTLKRLIEPELEIGHEKTVWEALFSTEDVITLTNEKLSKAYSSFISAKNQLTMKDVYTKPALTLQKTFPTILGLGIFIFAIMYFLNFYFITFSHEMFLFAIALGMGVLPGLSKRYFSPLPYFFAMIILMYFYSNLWFALILAAVVIISALIFALIRKTKNFADLLPITLALTTPFVIVFATIYSFPTMLMPIYFIVVLQVFICLLNVFTIFTNKRTSESQVLYGRILGFKNFLLKAEKDKLELLAKENPSYFYDILPYAYVLGVSDIYCKKFASIMPEVPYWYDGNVPSTNTLFSLYIISRINYTSRSMVMSGISRSSRAGGNFGGGFGGGGGFSGGGFGGGGARGR